MLLGFNTLEVVLYEYLKAPKCTGMVSHTNIVISQAGVLLMSQLLHLERVERLKCRTYAPPRFLGTSEMVGGVLCTGVSESALKWVRMAPNGTNQGRFKVTFQYILARRAKMY